jgi:Arc/MetJ family transcription regulator
MRISLEIDEKLMRDAMRSGQYATKEAAIEAGLRLLIQTDKQTGIRRLRGKVRWSGNLDESRRS